MLAKLSETWNKCSWSSPFFSFRHLSKSWVLLSLSSCWAAQNRLPQGAVLCFFLAQMLVWCADVLAFWKISTCKNDNLKDKLLFLRSDLTNKALPKFYWLHWFCVPTVRRAPQHGSVPASGIDTSPHAGWDCKGWRSRTRRLRASG